MKFDLQKNAEQIGGALGKVAEMGKKVADSTVAGAQSLAEKAQQENWKAQMKKYNPLFPEQYRDPAFGLPNMVTIVDDAVRKNIAVCKGAIGWKNQQKDVEVLYLYDEVIAFSGLQFVPTATCDAVYYVDPHDRHRFIRLDCYFKTMQDAKLAELQHIAYSLGAKEYNVEMLDVESEKTKKKQKMSVNKRDKAGILQGRAEISEESTDSVTQENTRKSVAHAVFTEQRKPVPPTLCWFAHDDNIRNLIAMRCESREEKSAMKAYTVEFEGTELAAMNTATAAKLDAAIKQLGLFSEGSMQSEAIREKHRKLVFEISF